jgi:hypothetical protein
MELKENSGKPKIYSATWDFFSIVNVRTQVDGSTLHKEES